MKVSRLKTFVVQAPPSQDGWIPSRNYVFVKIETDQGIEGWGEAFALSFQEQSIVQLLDEMGEGMIGKDPLCVRKFLNDTYRKFSERRAGLTYYVVLSALEMALWDISGKQLNSPVYKLLGGAVHESIRLYVNFWSPIDHTESDIAKKAVAFQEKGFSAVKVYPMRYGSVERAVGFVKSIRDAIGTEMDLMIDMSGCDDPVTAMQAAERFLQVNPYWIEEPVVHHDLPGLAKISDRLATRVVTGEKLAGLDAFRNVFLARAANIVNPDIATCGGIQTFLDIAAMARSFNVQVTPHNYGSMAVAQAAMLQVSALCSNCQIAEYFPYFQEFSDEITTGALEIEDGYSLLPEVSGLGIALDESVLRKYQINN